MTQDPVDYLSADDLHQVALGVVGPHMVVADWGLLASAAARPQASAFGEDAYAMLAHKVAAMLHSLVGSHALVDGNKRLGWAAAVVFFALNGVDLAPRPLRRTCSRCCRSPTAVTATR